MRARMLVAVVAAAVIGVAWIGLRGWPSGAAAGPNGTSSARGFRFQWPAGTEYEYVLSWRSDHTTVLPMGPGGANQEAAFHGDLAGTLTLRSLGVRSGVTVLALELSELTRYEISALGKPLVSDRASAEANLVGQTAYLEMEPSGAIRSVLYPAATAALFRHLSSGLLGSLHVQLSGGDATRWQASGLGPLGASQLEFAWEGSELVRARVGYTGREAELLEARARVELDPAGHLRSLSDEEHARLRAGEQPPAEAIVATRLTLRAVRRFTLPPDVGALLAGAERQAAGEVRTSGGTDRKLLEQRVEGYSGAQLLADLGAFANEGHLPDHNRWLWRATGLLKLEPALASQLVPLFAQRKLKPAGQGLVMDLLTYAGTPEAQAAMRAVLDLPHVRSDREQFVVLVQRLGLVSAPTRDTIDYVQALYAGRAESEAWSASAYALGGVAAGLASAGDHDGARALADRLAVDLQRAAGPEQKAVLLAAQGNAGLPEHEATVRGYAADVAPEVRAAAARALRKLDTPSAHGVVLGLVTDRDPQVQGAALDALGSHAPQAADLIRYRDAVKSGALHADHDHALMSLLVRYLVAGHDPSALLALILARHPGDAELENRARGLIAQATKLTATARTR